MARSERPKRVLLRLNDHAHALAPRQPLAKETVNDTKSQPAERQEPVRTGTWGRVKRSIAIKGFVSSNL
jgi:hypothetical protein